MTLRASGSGECNVKIYLINNPHNYDIFKVRVTSVVKPYSPVFLHVGGQVSFKIMENSDYSTKDTTIWSSNNPSVLGID